ncbi:hypothetical protein Cgig2_022625 [Carnegiea gigantea]|uniref:Uncharacterized protein n=1 Tax=Carnegiea gigantea TaxID=171969 RepID=A0A9Q1JY13_9CARY|nr:hypothetical protein Cgig2_022625 [Carnegiea gigantea]
MAVTAAPYLAELRFTPILKFQIQLSDLPCRHRKSTEVLEFWGPCDLLGWGVAKASGLVEKPATCGRADCGDAEVFSDRFLTIEPLCRGLGNDIEAFTSASFVGETTAFGWALAIRLSVRQTTSFWIYHSSLQRPGQQLYAVRAPVLPISSIGDISNSGSSSTRYGGSSSGGFKSSSSSEHSSTVSWVLLSSTQAPVTSLTPAGPRPAIGAVAQGSRTQETIHGSPKSQPICSYAELVDPNEGTELNFVPTNFINGITCTKLENSDFEAEINYWHINMLQHGVLTVLRSIYCAYLGTTY